VIKSWSVTKIFFFVRVGVLFVGSVQVHTCENIMIRKEKKRRREEKKRRRVTLFFGIAEGGKIDE
jgi:hypothetical protein